VKHSIPALPKPPLSNSRNILLQIVLPKVVLAMERSYFAEDKCKKITVRK
jgi:hypothetical protein